MGGDFPNYFLQGVLLLSFCALRSPFFFFQRRILTDLLALKESR